MKEENEDIGKLATQCLAPQFKAGNDRPCSESDFNSSEINSLLTTLQAQLTTRKNTGPSWYVKEIITPLLLIFGENNQRFPWNSADICQTCNELQKMVLSYSPHGSAADILVKGISAGKGLELRPLLKPALLSLRPKLLKETWKEYPAAVECFAWLLRTVQSPHLADHIPHVLPTALLLVDDFVNENRVIGINCLSRIIEDMTIAELKYHGYGQLIYKAIENLLRERDANLAAVLIPFMLSLVTKLEIDFGDVEPAYKWSRFDDMMEIFLEAMVMEQLIALRAIYISFMPAIIHGLGGRVHRWSKRMLSIFDHYLEVAGTTSDLESMLHSLKGLQIFLQATESVSKWYRNAVLLILYRQLHFLSEVNSEKLNYNQVKELTFSCLRFVLDRCTAEEVESILNDAESEMSAHAEGKKVLETLKSLKER